MSDKHSHMNHHVDPELIRRYLAGELDNKAMHALEKRALDDPFLADALEGFTARKPDQRVHLADLTKRLERRIQQNDERKGMVFNLNYHWLAAAGVLLLVGVGLLWIMQWQKNNETIVAQMSTHVSDSSITDTLQYYNREEPMAWGKATPEKPLAVSIPADTALLALKENRPILGPVSAEAPLASMMMRRDDSSRPVAATPAPADSLDGRMANVVVTRTQDAYASEMAEKPAVAYAPTITTRIIQGKVKASNFEEGVPGASVTIEGTGKGAVTDKDGNFSIRVADTTKDLKLVVAALGFDSKKMDLNQKENNLDIILREQVASLDEAVVSGYSKKGGYAKRKSEVYQLPTPEMGYEQYREYLAKNVHYPASAAANNITGKVRVSVRVMPDGTLEDIRITRRLQPDCDAEALRVVKEGPEWKPASDGKATRVQIDVPFAPK